LDDVETGLCSAHEWKRARNERNILISDSSRRPPQLIARPRPPSPYVGAALGQEASGTAGKLDLLKSQSIAGRYAERRIGTLNKTHPSSSITLTALTGGS